MRRANSGFTWLWLVLIVGTAFIGLLFTIFTPILYTAYYAVINGMVVDSRWATMLTAMLLVFTWLPFIALLDGVGWVYINSQRRAEYE